MEYNLTRSKRRTITIRVTKDAAVEVRAPMRMPLSSIDHFVNSKDKWIQKHVKEALDSIESRNSFDLSFGSTVMLRGKHFLIVPSDEKKSRLQNNELLIPKNLSGEKILDSVRALLKEHAKQYLPERTEYFAGLMEVVPTSVRIGSATTRWGSCNSNGKITYSWRIIMCDDSLIDYLVVHELAHLLQMNHSSKFWMEVEKIIPDYKNRRKHLKEFNKKLYCEPW